MARKGLMECPPTNLPDLESSCPIFLFNNATQITRGPTIDASTPPLVSCIKCIFSFSMLKASMYLPRILQLYVLILHTPLDSHPESNTHLLKS